MGYARWLIPPAALAVHLSIGQVYAFSVFKKPLVAHFDTMLTPIGWIFSIAILMLGLSAAFGGTFYLVRVIAHPSILHLPLHLLSPTPPPIHLFSAYPSPLPPHTFFAHHHLPIACFLTLLSTFFSSPSCSRPSPRPHPPPVPRPPPFLPLSLSPPPSILARPIPSSPSTRRRRFVASHLNWRPLRVIMVGVLAVGFIANLLIRPVNERFHETTDRQHGFERERPVEMPTMERS